MQKAVGVFVGLGNEIAGAAQPEVAADGFQDAADGKGGIQTGF